MFTFSMKTFKETKKVEIKDRDLANQFIDYLKNTTTAETHSSNAFGTAGTNGRTLFDMWNPIATDNQAYTLDLNQDENGYDAVVVLMALGAFLTLRNNSPDHQLINAEVPIPSKLELESSPEGTVSLFTGTRRYGTLVTSASFLNEMRQAKTIIQTQPDPIPEPLNPLLTQFQEAKNKLNKQISQFPAGKKLIEDLTNAYTRFDNTKDKTLAAKAFKVACLQAISTARPELEKAFGWGEYLLNQLKALANVVIRIASLFTCDNFFTKARSSAATALDNFELETSKLVI